LKIFLIVSVLGINLLFENLVFGNKIEFFFIQSKVNVGESISLQEGIGMMIAAIGAVFVQIKRKINTT